ncbi:MAG TPA: terminase family protein [Allosphingosinicella sp.]|jgi:phage terminase large subunit-like protein
MNRARARAVLAALGDLPPETRRVAFRDLPPAAAAAVEQSWWALKGQAEPPGEWRIWSIVAGRGFGKTRAGAEWVWRRARENPHARIALVAASLDEAARVMVEGESGLLACARNGEAPRWIRTRGLFLFPSGAQAFTYSAERPSTLRGPQHHHAWCDEFAKWPIRRADAAWDNLMLGLRLGERPRAIVTTTPAPVPHLRRVLAMPRSVATHGRTADNPHSPRDFREAMATLYAGTRLGRQELDGLLLEDLPGALWTRDMIEKARIPLAGREGLGVGPVPTSLSPSPSGEGFGVGLVPTSSKGRGDFTRTVIGVDPPASTQGDACGIVVCARDRAGIAWVLADLSVAGLRPEGWASRVAAAAEAWGATSVVAEKNQGGDMVESVLKAASCPVPIRLAHAAHGKAARAEPIALRFEKGEARLAGTFPELEDQLCGLTYAGYQGPGPSPDRADAMVWALTELFKPRAEPRVRRL